LAFRESWGLSGGDEPAGAGVLSHIVFAVLGWGFDWTGLRGKSRGETSGIGDFFFLRSLRLIDLTAKNLVRPDGRNQNGGLNRFPYPAGRGTTQHENGGTEKHFLTG
jgi:hypothetical protein